VSTPDAAASLLLQHYYQAALESLKLKNLAVVSSQPFLPGSSRTSKRQLMLFGMTRDEFGPVEVAASRCPATQAMPDCVAPAAHWTPWPPSKRA